MARGSRARHHAWRWPRVHCIALFRASVYLETGPPPRDGLILPPLGGCGPQAIARYTGPESSGDPQPPNHARPARQSRDGSGPCFPESNP